MEAGLRLTRWIFLGIVCCLANGAFAQSVLVVSVEADLTAECSDPAELSFPVCVEALRLHGIGKDNLALDTISHGTSAVSAGRYRIAAGWPKDQFWNTVATAGAPSINCARILPRILDGHFLYDSDALSAASSDYSKSPYTALYDLIQAIPPTGFPASTSPVTVQAFSAPDAINAYRFCFKDPDRLFTYVRNELKPRN